MKLMGKPFRRIFEVATASVLAIAVSSPALASVHDGDLLQVTVLNHPELSRRLTVDAAGTLSMPLAGTVSVRGLEPAQIASRIRMALIPFVISPAVDVELALQTASIFVTGPTGGTIKFLPGETLTAAMSLLPSATGTSGDNGSSGGVAALERSRIDLRRVSLLRDGTKIGTYDVTALAANGDNGPLLQPGDTIQLVNKSTSVRVIGDVKRPGTTFLGVDEPLSEAIEQAGGILPTAATSHVALVRDGVTQSLALGDVLFREPAKNGDSVTILTAPRVSVVGNVERPGITTLRNDFSLLNALYEAGGPGKRADLAHIAVIRNGTKSSYNIADLARGNVSQNAPLQDGDTIFVGQSSGVSFSGVFNSLLPFLFFIRR